MFLMIRRQEQALQEAFRRADNSSEGKLTVDDYLKVRTIVLNDFLRMKTMMMLKVLQDNRLTATKEEINMMMDIADKNKDG